MSIVIDTSAALVASPRLCAPVFGTRMRADDAQPRLLSRSAMPGAHEAWRRTGSSVKRGFETVVEREAQDGRTALAGAAYVTTNQHYSIRSGPPTSRPPA